MKKVLLMGGVFLAMLQADVLPSNGVPYPKGWRNWSVIAVSHRIDNHTLRAILGNDIAIDAIKKGLKVFPDGAILAKVVWKEGRSQTWKSAIVPKEFVHVECMVKDSRKYVQTRNWGWARWVGTTLKPYALGMQKCIACHTPVKDRDWVYTEPALFPR